MSAQNIPQHSAESTIASSSDTFISLFEHDRNRLYAYIYAFVLDRAAADDIFQETSMTLWREFEKFEINTNFSKWANGIAFNRIREYRRKHKNPQLGLSDSLIESISLAVSKPETNDDRWYTLNHCRSQLSDTEQQLYHAFYVQNLRAQAIAEDSGRSIFAIRKVIHKLRKKLFDCVDKNKKGEDA